MPNITEEFIGSPVWVFHHVGVSEWMERFYWTEKRIAKLEAEVERLQKWVDRQKTQINRMNGARKAAETRKRKQAKAQ